MAATSFQNTDVDKIKARLGPKLDQYFPECGKNLPTLHLATVSHRSYSDLYLFRTSLNGGGGSRGLAVKVFLPASGGQDAARLQFAALNSVWPAFRTSKTMTIPQPLDYFPELSAIVTERVQGRPLQQLFKTVALMPEQKAGLARLTEQSGQWLRKFHAATSLPPGRLHLDGKLESLRANLDLLQTFGFSVDLCRQVATCLNSLAKDIRNLELGMASVHGDFTVDNVLFDGKRIITIDLGGRDRNAVYHDIATFLNSLALIGLTWPLRRRSLVERCSRGFLWGYFGAADFSRSAVSFLRLAGLVSVVLEILERRSDQLLLVRWWIRPYLDRLCRQMIKDANG